MNIMQSLGALAISALFVFGLAVTDNLDESSTPIVVTIVGLAGLMINSTLNRKRVEGSVTVVEAKVDQVLNGAMEAKVEAALIKVLDARGYAGENNSENNPENPSQT